MNNIHNELLSMLKELTNCIKGKWFLSDGGLLGIIRENKLIEWDDDLDIYLLPDSYIDMDKLSKTSLNYYDYYCCGKIYRNNNEKFTKSTWNEYCSYLRSSRFKNKKINRCELYKVAKPSYNENKKEIKFTFPFIDILQLKKENDLYKVNGNCFDEVYYTNDEVDNLKYYNLNNIDIFIPNNSHNILKRLYGENYLQPNPKWKYI
jgi:hypothetical protein